MVSSAKWTRSAIAAASLALVATVATSTFAQAAETGDDRAVAFDGNVSTCADAGLAGENVDKGDLEFTGGSPSDQTLTISGVADGLDVTAIVVKGGDAYNVYEPGLRGLGPDVPWEDLIAPINDGVQQPDISHWFACAEKPETPPTTTTEPPTTTTEPPTTTTEPPSSTTTEPPASTEPPTSSEPPSTTTTDDSTPPSSTEPGETSSPASATTTTAAAVDTDESDDDLALTGFGAGWMIPIGALLIIGGGAALWLARARRA